MCGIFGAYNAQRHNYDEDMIRRMGQAIGHRGPDASGHTVRGSALMGSTRLSVLDLSSAGDQPIVSPDETVAVVQNGEIYNYLELRAELVAHGARFRSTGDTEVLLQAYLHWGADFVTKLNGMFAIAIHDTRTDTLHLYRDRLGVKPLFICRNPSDGTMWFASEIKALLETNQKVIPDLDAISQLMALNYIPQPSTVFEGIQHVPPANRITFSPSGEERHEYWNLAGVAPVPEMTSAEAIAGLMSLLDDATRLRMRSDAAIGAFLSGGLDSSTVVALMSQYQPEGVRTFSIGFEDPRFDESRVAAAAARRFGTSHMSRVMGEAGTDLWPRFIYHCDQPHGDVSFMPMDQVSALAAKEVKVVLTGDGGDELFAGYEKYLRTFPGGLVHHLSAGWEREHVVKSGLLSSSVADTLLIGGLRERFFGDDPYRGLIEPILGAAHQDPINRVLLGEVTALLPGNNLVKPDRMAMATSLEVRSPFLDYRLAEFAFRVPGHLKLRHGTTKAIYKAAVEPLLGSELTHRKKQMFTVPVGEWFRGRLREYCEAILLDGRLEDRRLTSPTGVRRLLDEHASGADRTREIRALISLELWFRIFVDRDELQLTMARRPALAVEHV